MNIEESNPEYLSRERIIDLKKQQCFEDGKIYNKQSSLNKSEGSDGIQLSITDQIRNEERKRNDKIFRIIFLIWLGICVFLLVLGLLLPRTYGVPVFIVSFFITMCGLPVLGIRTIFGLFCFLTNCIKKLLRKNRY